MEPETHAYFAVTMMIRTIKIENIVWQDVLADEVAKKLLFVLPSFKEKCFSLLKQQTIRKHVTPNDIDGIFFKNSIELLGILIFSCKLLWIPRSSVKFTNSWTLFTIENSFLAFRESFIQNLFWTKHFLEFYIYRIPR